jgi:hypothetical protein
MEWRRAVRHLYAGPIGRLSGGPWRIPESRMSRINGDPARVKRLHTFNLGVMLSYLARKTPRSARGAATRPSPDGTR